MILTIKDYVIIFVIASTVYNTGGKECLELLPILFPEVWQNEALVQTDSLLKEKSIHFDFNTFSLRELSRALSSSR